MYIQNALFSAPLLHEFPCSHPLTPTLLFSVSPQIITLSLRCNACYFTSCYNPSSSTLCFTVCQCLFIISFSLYSFYLHVLFIFPLIPYSLFSCQIDCFSTLSPRCSHLFPTLFVPYSMSFFFGSLALLVLSFSFSTPSLSTAVVFFGLSLSLSLLYCLLLHSPLSPCIDGVFCSSAGVM